MQLYTQIKKARNRFVGITIFTLVFSGIYEYFSHGVYSGFMIWAALIPFVGVVLPYTVWLKRTSPEAWPGHTDSEDHTDHTDHLNFAGCKDFENQESAVDSIYRSAILTFLLGSIFTGILEIYGTTNRLSKVYWITGGILLAISLGMMGKKGMDSKRLS